MTATESDVREALRDVIDPRNDEDVVSLRLVNEIHVEEDTARISLAFNTPYAPAEMEIGDRIREAVSELGLEPSLGASVEAKHGYDDEVLPTVRNVIAVASGKGGVGKTTVAANLAAGLHERGARVGLLDADVHGPNAPKVLADAGEPGVTPNGDIVPPRADGVAVMSMDYLAPDTDAPAIMRGPMVNSVMMKFIEEVNWGQLDYLVVDLPPGTGDASLNLLQTLPVAGVVIVTTPQEMAVQDAKKGLRLFDEHDTPVLGIVENMSAFHCPGCDDEHDVFGTGGGRDISEEYEVPLLAELPVHPDFDSDRFDGAVVRAEDSDVRPALEELVGGVADRVGEINRRSVREALADHEEPVPTEADD